MVLLCGLTLNLFSKKFWLLLSDAIEILEDEIPDLSLLESGDDASLISSLITYYTLSLAIKEA